MVELSRSFVRERLQRQPAAASLVSVPAVPRVPDESGALLRASATFTEGLAALGQSLSAFAARERHLAYAQDVAKTGEAVGKFQLGMAPLQQRMLEQHVPALERPAYLRQHGEELISTLVTQVPARMQPQFTAQATQDLARFVLAEQSAASRQFVTEQQQALPALLDLVGRQLVGADDRQRPAILASLTAIGTSYAEAGIVAAPLAQALVRETVDRQDTVRTQQQIMANPAAMQQHLRALSAGQPGTPGLPVPPAKDLADLTRQANVQVSQDLARVEQEERRAGQELRQTQEANMVRLQGRLYQTDVTDQQVHRLEQEANTLAEQRQLSKEDHGQILRESRALRQTLAQGPQVSSPATKARVLRELYGGEMGGTALDSLRETIVQGMIDGQVNMKDAQEWMQEISRQRSANYYTNVPAYKESRQFLDHTVNYLAEYRNNPTVNQENLARLESRAAYALQEYSLRLKDIWEREGPRGVEAQAPQVARDVHKLFGVTPREVLQYFPEPEPLRVQPPGGTLQERYQGAYERLREAPLADKDKAEQVRLLRSRQRLEEEVERSEAAEPALRKPPPPAAAGPPPPAPPPAPFTPQGEIERQKQQGFAPGQTVPQIRPPWRRSP